MMSNEMSLLNRIKSLFDAYDDDGAETNEWG